MDKHSDPDDHVVELSDPPEQPPPVVRVRNPRPTPQFISGGISLSKIAQTWALVTNLLFMATAIVGLVDNVPTNFSWDPSVTSNNGVWAVFFFCLGMILFSVLGISGEAKFPVFLRHMGIWPVYWMRAIWYSIMGLFVIGIGGLIGICCGLLMWCLSIYLAVLHFLAHDVGYTQPGLVK